ncbi:MAG: helix-turn-helix transcriptional regulator [Candidatus Hydrogenedentes bacterium]|nr:helix-turn-helix transcriptional regulator [Candidatus Hydrogenedentota bacterium]
MSKIDFRLADSARFMSVRRWRAGSEWHPRPHAHRFCELIVVLHGAERAIIDNKAYVCETGHALFYPPDSFHAEWQEGHALLEFYCIEFQWKDCPKDMPNLVRDRKGRLLELARWLNAESLTQYPGDSDYQELAGRMLVAELIRLAVSPSHEVVDRVSAFVRDHMQEPIALDDLAAWCKLNKFHLVRVFRSLTGLTPMEYVRSERLDTALRLLQETSLPLRSIAPRVGFSDEYHLSRLLKARFGQGARELRKQKAAEVEA